MTDAAGAPQTAGPAYRVSILGPEQVEAYMNVHVVIDREHPVLHVFAADATTHYLTIPLSSALVEWKDPSALNPQLRMPGFGAGAFEQLGEQVQRMMEGMRHGLGPE